ncbi:uncharacterized protein LOC121956746 [Plectropomus leopardus]|uniref:uncharacterized protein LOC121956746 n=1 Tax=Plectropomus leopardus TaxID=160734 RepID=UPI001C4C4B66|nr:uncharacterized protein LOC121956746 [Plectropomus leopardus]XP_042361053.1 uncharacterized protein LOC121956746 [Plectropomus leopardus]
MTPPKPPRTKYATLPTITSSYEVPQPTYEDPDAPTPVVTVETQPEVKVKPVPRPRSKIQPKSQSNNNNNNTADSADTTSNTADAESGYPADYKTPRPVRPPPRPPLCKSLTLPKSSEAVDEGSHYVTSISEPTPAAVSPETIQTPPPKRPQRPPPPSIYYDSPHSAVRLKSESYSDGSQSSRSSYSDSMRQSPVPAAVSEEEEVNLFGTYSTTVTERPAVPPRLWQSSLPRTPPESRPPPPSFTPPPPPPSESQSVYSEIEHRPYLDVLPEEDDNITLGRPTLSFQTGSYSSHQQNAEDTEDIIGMLRWLKKVSKSDLMVPPVYGLSIEEEIRSFNQRAMTVKKALRLYNLLMIKRNEGLRNIIIEFNSISDHLDKMKKKTKTMDIAGGTTGAVGGVTAVLGIALAPVTFGTSLIATAVGAGMVASAGGMGAHTAKVKKNVVNRMTVEKLVYDYKGDVVDLEHCLSFILSGMNELRRHDIARIQRAGGQPDAVRIAHLSQSVFRTTTNNDRRSSVAHTAGMSSERLLMAFVKEMDQYFSEKDDLKLKKSNKSKFSGRVRLLAKNLQDELDQMNLMWEMFG